MAFIGGHPESGCASQTAYENIPSRNSAEMRFARKASSRPSHASVPGFTRPPAPRRKPQRYVVCRETERAGGRELCASRARGAAVRRGKGLVPRRSSSRTCKSRTVPFSKARTMSSIESSPDAWPCKMRAGGAAQRDSPRRARTFHVVEQARRFAGQAAHVPGAYGIRRAADPEARAGVPLFTPETCAGHCLTRKRVFRDGVARCPARRAVQRRTRGATC
jgi:hypothetical protein